MRKRKTYILPRCHVVMMEQPVLNTISGENQGWDNAKGISGMDYRYYDED